jgi:hypothetical protein
MDWILVVAPLRGLLGKASGIANKIALSDKYLVLYQIV